VAVRNTLRRTQGKKRRLILGARTYTTHFNKRGRGGGVQEKPTIKKKKWGGATFIYILGYFLKTPAKRKRETIEKHSRRIASKKTRSATALKSHSRESCSGVWSGRNILARQKGQPASWKGRCHHYKIPIIQKREKAASKKGEL